MPTDIAGDNSFDPVEFFKVALHAPEAAAGKNSHILFHQKLFSRAIYSEGGLGQNRDK
jgi:hypothetical protein